MASLHDFEMELITGESLGLDNFRDQMALVVNVASQ
ncbi:MAG: glutathione peroxidase-family protein [Acidimicrobiales bacterium]|jgi:glutathione peroxidase-family protein